MFRTRFRRLGVGRTRLCGPDRSRSRRRDRAADAARAAPEDVLLLHHSAYAPGVRELLTLSNPKLLLYHNITPAQWLWDHAPIVAAHCAVGRAQLPSWSPASTSRPPIRPSTQPSCARPERLQTQVIPLLIAARSPRPTGTRQLQRAARSPDRAVRRPAVSPQAPGRGDPRVCAVPAATAPRHARLNLVGDPLTLGYARYLAGACGPLAPGAVTIESGLSDVQLGERYRGAHAFLCLSEHEGFCIPLLEALHFGMPVIARPHGAIPEVAGDAALLVDDADLAVVAELIHLAVSDASLRAELRRRGERRLAAYAPDAVAERLRAAVLGGGRPARSGVSTDPICHTLRMSAPPARAML